MYIILPMNSMTYIMRLSLFVFVCECVLAFLTVQIDEQYQILDFNMVDWRWNFRGMQFDEKKRIVLLNFLWKNVIHLWNAIHHNNAQIDHCGTKDKGSFSFHMKTTSTNQNEFECKTFERATLHANCTDYKLIYKFLSATIYFITTYYCRSFGSPYIFYLSIFDIFDQIWNIYSSEKVVANTPIGTRKTITLWTYIHI